MGKETVLEVDAYMRHTPLAVGEEDDVAFAQLAFGDERDVLLHIVGHTVQVDVVYFAVDVAYKAGAVDPVFVGPAIAVGGSYPGLDGVVQLLVIVGAALDAEGVDVAGASSLVGDCWDVGYLLDVFVHVELAQ